MAQWIVTNTVTLLTVTYYAGSVVRDGADPIDELRDAGAALVEAGTIPNVDAAAALARSRKQKGDSSASLSLLMLASRQSSSVKSVWFSADPNTSIGSYQVRQVLGTGAHTFNLRVPSDFESLVSLDLLYIPSSGPQGSGRNIDFISQYAAVGEPFNQHTESDVTTAYTIGAANVVAAFDVRGVVSQLAANDVGGLYVLHTAIGGALSYLGISMEYR